MRTARRTSGSAGTRVHVASQLIDTESDAHLWAERFDCDTADRFALQDEITTRIAIVLDLELIGAGPVSLVSEQAT